MNEAQIIGSCVIGLAALVALYFAVYNPMKENVKAITKLTVTIDNLNEKLISLESKNTESHRRIWKTIDIQESKLDSHEKRLHDLDGKWSLTEREVNENE